MRGRTYNLYTDAEIHVALGGEMRNYMGGVAREAHLGCSCCEQRGGKPGPGVRKGPGKRPNPLQVRGGGIFCGLLEGGKENAIRRGEK